MTNLNQVLQVISTLFSSSTSIDSIKRREADSWLRNFQKTDEAWQLAHIIMTSESSNPEAKLFAAQTFRQKIIHDIHSTDDSFRGNLYNSILELLYTLRHGPKNTITQLVMSLANLSVLLAHKTDVVSTLLNSYQQEEEMLPCILEFLTVLPEELHDMRLDNESTMEIGQKLLQGNAQLVLNLILNLQGGQEGEGELNLGLQESILKVCYSWLRSGDFSLSWIYNTPLFQTCFQALKTEALFDVGCDLICEIIYASSISLKETPISSWKEQDRMIMEKIYNELTSLVQLLANSVDDALKTRALCRVFVEAGEAYVQLLIAYPESFTNIMSGILICSDYEDLDVVPITFHFWHALTDELLLKYPSSPIPACFQQAYLQLLEMILKHLHYPSDLEEWNSTEKDDFREFRYAIGSVLKDCICILKEYDSLSVPWKQLSARMALGNPADWQSIEAPLFSIRQMCSQVSHTENVILPQIMQLLPQLPQHPKIRYAVILVMGRYAEWTNEHPEYIPYQLQVVSSGFEDKEVIAASAQTLKDLCKYCCNHLKDYLPQLHSFYMNVMFALPLEDKKQVVEAVAHVISVVDFENLTSFIQSFCLPIIQRLALLSEHGHSSNGHVNGLASNSIGNPNNGQQAQGVNGQEEKEIAELIDIFAVYLKHLIPKNIPQGQSHPCVLLLKETWPVLKSILFGNLKTEKIAESGARLMRGCIISYRHYMMDLVPEWAESLGSLFENSGFGCWIWVSAKFVYYYGSAEKPTSPVAHSLVERMSCTVLQLSSIKHVELLDEVMEEYFYLVTEYMEASPDAFLFMTSLPLIFSTGVKSLEISHSGTLVSLLRWFNVLFECKSSLEGGKKISSLLADPSYGGAFIASCIKGLLLSFPKEREIVSEVATCFKSFYGKMERVFMDFLFQVLESYNSAQVPDKQVFLQKVVKAMTEKDVMRLSSCLQDFAITFARRNATLTRS